MFLLFVSLHLSLGSRFIASIGQNSIDLPLKNATKMAASVFVSFYAPESAEEAKALARDLATAGVSAHVASPTDAAECVHVSLCRCVVVVYLSLCLLNKNKNIGTTAR